MYRHSPRKFNCDLLIPGHSPERKRGHSTFSAEERWAQQPSAQDAEHAPLLPIMLLAPEDLRHNKLKDADRAFYDWYRFVLSYPPHLVRDYFSRFELKPGHRQLPP